MVYVNHNKAIRELGKLLDKSLNKNLNYMSENFNKEQHNAVELLKSRIYLEEVIDECVSFNKKLNWERTHKNLNLATTTEDLVEVFKLRSNVYTNLNYQEEFPDTLEGLNFDKYDKNSAILFYKSNSKITGTTRLIFDSKNKLPTEKKISFDNLRDKYGTIGELSRLIVEKEKKGLNLEFKYLMQGIHTLFMNNKIDITILTIIKEHYKLYTKFGGSKIIHEIDNFGNLGHSTYILTWNPSLVSSFFKRIFLNLGSS